MLTRKYPASIGEPDTFDFDGTLRDRKLTLDGARAMRDAIVKAVPELQHGPTIDIRIGYSKTVGRRGTFTFSRSRNRLTGEVTYRRGIILHKYRDGMTEKTMLHELAHAAGPRWEHHGKIFGEWCLKLEAIWLDILTGTNVADITPTDQGAGAAPKFYSAAADTGAK